MKFIKMSDYNRAARAYLGALVIAGSLTTVYALIQCLTLSATQWMQLAILSGFIFLTNSRPIRIPDTNDNVTIGDAFIFLGVLFLGVPGAVLLGIVGSSATLFRTSKRATTWCATLGMISITAFTTAQVFYFVLGNYAGVARYPLGRTPLSFEEITLPLVAMTVCHYTVTGLLVSIQNKVRERSSFRECWRNDYLWTAWTFFASAIATALIYEGVVNYRFVLLYVIVGIPVIGVSYASYKIYFERVMQKTKEATEMNRKHVEMVEAHARQAAEMHRLHLSTVESLIHNAEEMGRLHQSTVEALATAIDAKDQTSHFHVRRVQVYATEMGKAFNLPEREIEALKAGALLHDIGKLAVPDNILNKATKLTPAEFEKMKIHTMVGTQIVERVNFPYPVALIVRHHHERWDGKGYPDGLRGEEIPFTARILSVVDTFDAMREDRPWRKGVSRDEAIAYLVRGAGTQFDSKVVKTLIKNLACIEAELHAQGLDIDGYLGEQNSKVDAIEGDTWVFSSDKLASRQSIHLSSDPSRPSYLDQIRSAHREVFALYEIARTFSLSLDIKDMGPILVEKVEHIVPFDTCALFLIDEEKQQATVAHAAGLNAELLRGQIVMPGSGTIGTLLATGRLPKLLSHPMLDFAHLQFPPDSIYHSIAALPLVKGKRIIGALVVYSLVPNRFNNDHLRLLDTVARLAADALGNAIHHAATQSSALTDSLTQLPNKRALYERFIKEAARAERTHTSFQVVMMDLDDFKKVNDTYGHLVGDHLLREISQRIQEQLREYDFLARYAGDEFVALVPELSDAQFEELRKRLESAVLNYALPIESQKEASGVVGQIQASVGISIGAAYFGVDGNTLDQLILAADQAMYHTKARHKKVTHSTAEFAIPTPPVFADTLHPEELASVTV